MPWYLSHKLLPNRPLPPNARWVQCDDTGYPLSTADYRELGCLKSVGRVMVKAETCPPTLPVQASGAAIAILPHIQATIKVDCQSDPISPLVAQVPRSLLDREIYADDFSDGGDLSDLLSNATIEYTVSYSITGWGHTHRCTCKRWATSAPGPLVCCPKCQSMGAWECFTEPPPKIPEGWARKV